MEAFASFLLSPLDGWALVLVLSPPLLFSNSVSRVGCPRRQHGLVKEVLLALLRALGPGPAPLY